MSAPRTFPRPADVVARSLIDQHGPDMSREGVAAAAREECSSQGYVNDVCSLYSLLVFQDATGLPF